MKIIYLQRQGSSSSLNTNYLYWFKSKEHQKEYLAWLIGEEIKRQYEDIQIFIVNTLIK